MTTELEIDRDEFDAFVRETLNLGPDTELTDFQYGVVQDKIANHEVDLMSWLEKRRAAAASASKAPKFPKPGEMKNLPPASGTPQPPKGPAAPANKPAEKPAEKPAAAGKPVFAGKTLPAAPAGKSPAAAPTPKRSPGKSRASRHVAPKKGVGFFSLLITFLLVIVTVVIGMRQYVPLENREKMAQAEWLKSVPPGVVEWLFFSGQHQESSVTLQYGTPVSAFAFASKKPFRANGTLLLGTPVADSVAVLLEIVSTSGGETFRQPLEFKTGEQEVEFEAKMPAGDYDIRLRLDSEMTSSKLPSNFNVAIRY